MFEIFKNPKLDWMGLKKYFIGLSLVLTILGVLSVYIRGFNLSIDFAGGTLVTVKFKGTRLSEDRIREALAKQGINKDNIIVQPVNDPLGNASNQVLIRLPLSQELSQQLSSMSSLHDVLAAQTQTTSPAQGAVPSTTPPATPAASAPASGTLSRPGSPAGTPNPTGAPAPSPSVPAPSSPAQSSTAEDAKLGVEKAVVLKALESFNDPSDVANKTDLNNVGRESLRNKLVEADLLGLVASAGQASATTDYSRYADMIVDYRGQQGGVINQYSDLKSLSGLPQGLVDKLPDKFYLGTAVLLSAEVVGPQIGQELRQRAIYVVLASFVGILVYIAFRFEWIYGVAAVIAVFHDLLITMGLFSLFNKEISLNVVAALLTLAGYSVNDTIVVFDRIRENLKLRRRDNLVVIVNDSINQTLSRTIITSGLTFVTVFCLWVFGGPVLDGFSLAMVIGILIGTYSSIAIASPLMVWWKRWQEQRAQTRRHQEAGARQRKMVAS